MLIIHISGPPASGKTTLIRVLKRLLRENKLKSINFSWTGFHYWTYAYAMFLLNIFRITKILSRIYINTHVKRFRRNPYDLIPKRILTKHILLIFCLELLSLHVKYLAFKLKSFLLRPFIIMIDEGILNTIFYYIVFFSSRGSSLWKPLVRHVLRLWKVESRDSIVILVVLMPEVFKLVNQWGARGDLPSLDVGTRHIYYYTSILRTLIKAVEVYINNIEIYMFTDNVKALKDLLKLVKSRIRHE